MLMDLMFIENPKDKNKLNFYLNDNNYYVKNSLKMRKKHLKFYNNKIRSKKEEQAKYPVPKILYSTSGNYYRRLSERKKEFIKEQSPKYVIQDLVDVVNKFANELDFDDEESNDEKFEEDKKFNLSKEEEETKKETITKKGDEFFLTNKNEYKTINIKAKSEKNKLFEDLEFAKAKSDVATTLPQLKKINKNKKLYKSSLLFEDYGKYKFTRTGITYPKKLKKYELPEYEGKNEDQKNYYNYLKKVKNPNLVYNKISNFSEVFNKDLGTISTNYGNTFSRTRFSENPLLKKYMEMIPIYDIYKDLKQIENRYSGSKYKFKLLPLYNKRITNLDKLADKFYKAQAAQGGLGSLLNIQSSKC